MFKIGMVIHISLFICEKRKGLPPSCVFCKHPKGHFFTRTLWAERALVFDKMGGYYKNIVHYNTRISEYRAGQYNLFEFYFWKILSKFLKFFQKIRQQII